MAHADDQVKQEAPQRKLGRWFAHELGFERLGKKLVERCGEQRCDSEEDEVANDKKQADDDDANETREPTLDEVWHPAKCRVGKWFNRPIGYPARHPMRLAAFGAIRSLRKATRGRLPSSHCP